MKINKEKIIEFIATIIYLLPVIIAPILIIFTIYCIFNILSSDLPFWMKWFLLTSGGK